MTMCWAPYCKHYSQRETCRYFKFPKEPKERNRWKKLVRRNVEPGPGAYLCSCHFRDGKKENGPEIFLYNATKRFTVTSPEKRKRRKNEVAVQEHSYCLPGKRQLEGVLEPDMPPPPFEIETIVVDDLSSSDETSVCSDIPELLQLGTSVELQSSCPSKDSAVSYVRLTSSVVAEETQPSCPKNSEVSHVRLTSSVLTEETQPSCPKDSVVSHVCLSSSVVAEETQPSCPKNSEVSHVRLSSSVVAEETQPSCPKNSEVSHVRLTSSVVTEETQPSCPKDSAVSHVCLSSSVVVEETQPSCPKDSAVSHVRLSSSVVVEETQPSCPKDSAVSHVRLCSSDVAEETQPSCPKDSEISQILLTASVEAEAENCFLKKKIEDLECELENLKVRFSFKHIKGKDSLTLLYTGLPKEAIFLALYHFIEDIEINYHLNWKVDKISRIDQLLMCLMKLRQNFPHADIAHRFQVSEATVNNVIITWINVLHKILFERLMCSNPRRNKNATCVPTFFSTFICTEMSTVTPRSVETQTATNSSYKRCNTWKALVGITPKEVITFVSVLYPSSKSDNDIVKESGVVKLLKAGDLILADKGFLLKDILPPGVHINTPTSVTNPQCTTPQVQPAESVTRARLHLDRATRRMKCYKILKSLPSSLIPHANAVVQVIAALANLPFTIKEVEKFYAAKE